MILRAILAAAAAAAFAAPARMAAEPAPAPALRVMTWNIHHGIGVDGKYDLARIAEVIRARKPDLVMLQEVDKECVRSLSQDQPAELAKLTGLQAVFAKSSAQDGGETGLAILTRFTPGEVKVTTLPRGDEPRILLTTRVETPDGQVILACTLLDASDASRRLAQAQIVSSALLGASQPVVLAGDFNDVPGTPVLTVFAQAPWSPVPKQQPANTCPANSPTKEIDHIILRGLRARETAVVIADSSASDHRPVVALASPPK